MLFLKKGINLCFETNSIYMKKNTLLLILSIALVSLSNAQTNVYFLPGQGADERLFSKITLDSNFTIKQIAYTIPEKRMTMKEVAQLLVNQIDTTKIFYLVGTSLGGMISVELADLIHPEKVILISSAKTSMELPRRYRFQQRFHLNRVVPKTMIKLGAIVLQPLVEPDRNKEKSTFKSMLRRKEKRYMKQSVEVIINWKRRSYAKNIVHIHGDNDHTLPIKNIKADYIIKGGSHMMTLTRGEEINALILKILKE
jgi:pimeloyl-ACP methyl ester carboxylesterase